jgi:hypothetical protein
VPRPLLLGALVAGLLAAVLGASWFLAPRAELFGGPPEASPLEQLLGPAGSGAALAIAALLAVATALAALARSLPRPALRAVAVLQVLVAGIGMGSFSTLSTAGYLLALAMPLVIALLVVQVMRRYPRARLGTGLAVALAATVGATALRPALAELAGYMAPALIADLPAIAATLLLVAVGALWAAIAALSLRADGGARRATAWVARHRVLFTVLAACGPLPYALLRLTWLTPWPLLAPEALDLSTRVWGLALSTGSWLGVVLTLGLIRPWGEVFPRWMPVLAGREVPIAAAAVPGGVVAALMSFAALPMLIGVPGLPVTTVLSFAVIFPCWLWGPALGLAVWGYVGHRRDQQERGSAPEVDGASPA